MSDGIYRGSVYANVGRDDYTPGDIVAVNQPEAPDERYVDIYAPRHADDEEPWVCLDPEPYEFGRRYATEDAMPRTLAQGNACLLIDGTTSRPVSV